MGFRTTDFYVLLVYFCLFVAFQLLALVYMQCFSQCLRIFAISLNLVVMYPRLALHMHTILITCCFHVNLFYSSVYSLMTIIQMVQLFRLHKTVIISKQFN